MQCFAPFEPARQGRMVSFGQVLPRQPWTRPAVEPDRGALLRAKAGLGRVHK